MGNDTNKKFDGVNNENRWVNTWKIHKQFRILKCGGIIKKNGNLQGFISNFSNLLIKSNNYIGQSDVTLD